MAVTSKHPDYADRMNEWADMRHAARGETAVKREGEAYLPMPSGFRAQPDSGRAMYAAYQKRAQFPDILAPTIRGMLGVIHRTEAQIEMPDALLGIWERATRDGLTLEGFHRRVTAELLTTGRYGILVDAPMDGAELPFFAGYAAEAIINWAPDRDFYVLDESGKVRDGFEWRDARRHRVLELVDGMYTVRVYDGEQEGGEEIQPRVRGGGALDEIPFVVVGPQDVSAEPEEPPLLGVASSSLALYRLDADYRHQLYMSGQETLVIINGEAPPAVGAGVVLVLDGGDGRQPDAKYVGPAGTGISAHRTAILDERENAVAAGARIFDHSKKAAESGEALRLRYAAQTATLTSIAQASAAGLEKALRHAAIMIGADPQEAVVKPNLDHLAGGLTPTDAEALVRVWQSGAVSYQTLYERLQRGEVASPERDHEEEFALIDAERFGAEVDPAESGIIPSPRSAGQL